MLPEDIPCVFISLHSKDNLSDILKRPHFIYSTDAFQFDIQSHFYSFGSLKIALFPAENLQKRNECCFNCDNASCDDKSCYHAFHSFCFDLFVDHYCVTSRAARNAAVTVITIPAPHNTPAKIIIFFSSFVLVSFVLFPLL